MKRVFFVIPPSRGDYGRPGYPHVGISYLASTLTKAGIEVRVADMRLGDDIKKVIENAKKFKPDLVGVTTYTLEYLGSYSVINSLKNSLNVPVAAGGPHVAVMGEDLMRNTQADFAIIGEGEKVSEDICSDKELAEIESVIYRNGEELVFNKRAQPIQDLNNLPFPAYDVFDLSKYDNRQIPIVSSRGCPYHCVYCSIMLTMSRIWRPRSPENVVDEIKHWYNLGYSNFQFTDDNFTLDMNRAHKICDLIIEEKLDIKWDLRNGVRVDRVDEELMHKMADAGCFFVAFGIESGNQKILDAMKKGITLEQVSTAVAAAKNAKLRTSGFFIVGTPEETFETVMDSIKFSKGLELNETRFYNALPYPGTEFFRWVKENGIFIKEPSEYLNGMSHQREAPVFETVEFTYDERVKALHIAQMYSLKRNYRNRFKAFGYLAYHIYKQDNLRKFGRYTLSSLRKVKNAVSSE